MVILETKQRYKQPGITGKVYPVPLPTTSPLALEQGVEFVIHCVSPNMNDRKSNCLKGDYERGAKLLQQTYSNLLEAFATLANLH